MTIIYERVGKRIIRLTKCRKCDADTVVKIRTDGSHTPNLCVFCKKRVRHATA